MLRVIFAAGRRRGRPSRSASPSAWLGNLARVGEVRVARVRVKTPLHLSIQRHSPLSPHLATIISPSPCYTGRMPGADISYIRIFLLIHGSSPALAGAVTGVNLK